MSKNSQPQHRLLEKKNIKNMITKGHVFTKYSFSIISNLRSTIALPGYFGDLFRHSKYVKNTLFFTPPKVCYLKWINGKTLKGATIRQAYSFVIQSSAMIQVRSVQFTCFRYNRCQFNYRPNLGAWFIQVMCSDKLNNCPPGVEESLWKDDT